MSECKGQSGGYRYWTVGQAILNKEWREKHGDDWRNIRVEVTKEGDPYPCEELSIFFKPADSSLPDWIDDLETPDAVLSVEEIVSHYREETGEHVDVLNRGGEREHGQTA